MEGEEKGPDDGVADVLDEETPDDEPGEKKRGGSWLLFFVSGFGFCGMMGMMMKGSELTVIGDIWIYSLLASPR